MGFMSIVIMMKTCSKCNLEKQNSEFYVKNKKTGLLQSYCIICHNACSVRNYKAKKQAHYERQKKRRNTITEHYRKIKEVPCTDCKQEFPGYVMEFDHLRDKKFTIGANFWKKSKELVDAEIEKCDVVCANCHRIRTYKRRNEKCYLVPANSLPSGVGILRIEERLNNGGSPSKWAKEYEI